MKARNKWVIAVILVAVAGVLIAKGTAKRSWSGRSAVAPRRYESGRPITGSRATRAVPSRKAPRSPGEKPEGPLPGSKLEECLKSGRPTMADFGRGWCVPCKMMVPVLKRAAQDYWGKANIVFVELDEYAALGRKHRIVAMPTQIFFSAKGKEVSRHMGYMGTEDIERELAALGVKK
jgi:thioredoxin 1